MGKRSDFERIEKDYYRTIDPKAVKALRPHVAFGDMFVEPCAGAGDLTKALEGVGLSCYWESDIEPQSKNVEKYNAFDALDNFASHCEWIITNPPWSRNLLHTMIEHFQVYAPTWLLFDADWAHTKQASPYLKTCKKIVSIGRLLWIPGTKMTGKDNCAWYLFDKNHKGPTEFYGR